MHLKFGGQGNQFFQEEGKMNLKKTRIWLCAHLCVCVCICGYVSVCICLCVYLSVYVSVCLSVYICVYMSMCLCVSECLCVCVSVCIYVYVSMRVYIWCVCVYLSVCLCGYKCLCVWVSVQCHMSVCVWWARCGQALNDLLSSNLYGFWNPFPSLGTVAPGHTRVQVKLDTRYQKTVLLSFTVMVGPLEATGEPGSMSQ